MGVVLVEHVPPSGRSRRRSTGERVASLPNDSNGSRARVIDGTLRCVARYGLSKTTVDDIAREARLSRATVYRVFPGGRDEIIGASVGREIGHFFDGIARRLDGIDDLEDRLVVAMTAAAEQLAGHDALGFVLAHEPALVLPRVSFGELDCVLALSGGFLAGYLAGWLDPEDALRVGEWVTRLVLSYVVCPSGAVDGLSLPGPNQTSFKGGAGTPFAIHPEPLGEARARRLVRQFVMPGIEVLMSARAGRSEPAGAMPTPTVSDAHARDEQQGTKTKE